MGYDFECVNRNVTLNIAGYRDDVEDEQHMWVAPCNKIALDCEKNTFSHTCDTTGGMSGAPLWVFRKAPDGGSPIHSVRGIHIGSDITTKDSNRAVFLTQENYDRINEWLQQAASLL
eukprot:TRINITY_DN7331_c0_g1_i2.p6 TRINITY_DN7331_c0_g1~~TRINITY_DN7331_c0_g1_i2.p6  ORF type:complete len:117 (-),score=17.94 TRINITY_DN7331_c0_g1_i2:390-740(-)